MHSIRYGVDRCKRQVSRFAHGEGSWTLVFALAITALFSVLVKYGWSLFPDFTLQLELARTWQRPQADGHVALSSPLSFLLPGLLNVTSDSTFLIWSLSMAAIAVAAPLVVGGRNVSNQSRLLIFVFVVGGPTSAVLVQWVGGYDAIFVVIACVATLTKQRWLSLACWALIGFQHLQIGVIAWAVLSCVRYARGRIEKTDLLELVAMAVGFLGLQLMLTMWQADSSRLDVNLNDTIGQFAWNPSLILWSALGAGWLLLISAEIFCLKGIRVFLLLGLVTVFVLGPLVLDQTRVLALVLYIPMLWLLKDIGPSLNARAALQTFKRYGLIATAVPVVVVWGGVPTPTGYIEMLPLLFSNW